MAQHDKNKDGYIVGQEMIETKTDPVQEYEAMRKAAMAEHEPHLPQEL